MPIINNNAKEIHCKIVYYGSSGSGKTSCINFIKKNSEKKKISSFSIPLEPPLEVLVISIGEILGLKTFFHIYVIPDLSLEEKKYLLQGVDGIVFVANSELTAAEKNEQSLNELHKILQTQEVDIFKIPLVFQYNKRDLSETIPIEILRAKLNKYNCKDFESSVTNEQKIMQPLKYLFKAVLTILKSGEIQ